MSLKPPISPNTVLDFRHVYDEGTELAPEDGINFTGAGVTVTEDAPNGRLNVTIPGGGGGTGVLQSVDALSSNPRAETDWGPILNTALAAGTRGFEFGAFDYPFSTQIVLTGGHALYFRGTGGVTWADDLSSYPKSRLLWKGTGAGVAILADSPTNGVTFADMAVCYDQATYTGNLMHFVAGGVCIERCLFASTDVSTIRSANTFISLAGSVGVWIHDCGFSGAQYGLRGVEGETGSTGTANSVTVSDCVFGTCIQAGIWNFGVGWDIRGCTFEFASHMLVGVGSQYRADNVTIRDCYFWDNSDPASICVHQTTVGGEVGFWYGVRIHNCFFFTGFTQPNIKLDGDARAIEVTCCTLSQPVDLGTVSKDSVRIHGNYGPDPIVKSTHLDGHRVMSVFDNTADTGGPSWEFRNLFGIERIRRNTSTTIAIRGAPANLASVDIRGNDVAGIILLSSGGGGAVAAGLLADVTFARAAPDGAGIGLPSGIGTFGGLLVHVYPIQVATQANIVDAVGAGLYGQVSGTTATGFTIGSANGFAANKSLLLGYRVVQLVT